MLRSYAIFVYKWHRFGADFPVVSIAYDGSIDSVSVHGDRGTESVQRGIEGLLFRCRSPSPVIAEFFLLFRSQDRLDTFLGVH